MGIALPSSTMVEPLIQWLQEVFTEEAIRRCLHDPRFMTLPVVSLVVLWRRIGLFKSTLFALLGFTVLLATWHEIELGACAGRMLIMGALAGAVFVYFVYLVALRGQVRD